MHQPAVVEFLAQCGDRFDLFHTRNCFITIKKRAPKCSSLSDPFYIGVLVSNFEANGEQHAATAGFNIRATII
jgi:hypothetical protein